MSHIEKWGFGMAQFKPETEAKYRHAIIQVNRFVIENLISVDTSITDDISIVKGLFNRIIRQDQWDWFTVSMYMDYPSDKDSQTIVRALSELRKAFLSRNNSLGECALNKLMQSHFTLYCDNFLNFDLNENTQIEYLYILSRREEPDILKIGMTTRNVQKRVNEINSATGVLYPFFARKVYKVRNCRQVEKDVHTLLSQYRIRSDREFFKLSYGDACSIIEQYLENSKQFFYSI